MPWPRWRTPASRSYTGPNAAGNIFNLDAQGLDVVLDQTHITVGGAEPILFDTLGTIELTNPGNITVLGASSRDALVVTATGTAAGSLQLNNGPTGSIQHLAFAHLHWQWPAATR